MRTSIYRLSSLASNLNLKFQTKKRKVSGWSDISDIIGPVIPQPGKLITYWSRERGIKWSELINKWIDSREWAIGGLLVHICKHHGWQIPFVFHFIITKTGLTHTGTLEFISYYVALIKRMRNWRTWFPSETLHANTLRKEKTWKNLKHKNTDVDSPK